MKTPKLLIGAPGTGKTASVRAKFEHTEVLLLSSCTEEDIAGLPYREGNKERRTMPLFIENINKAVKKGKKTCLFLDELDKARREVVDTLLTLITHPTNFGIPESVEIIAAANPPEWGGGDGISQPMLTRFCVIPFSPDVNEWVKLTNKLFSDLTVTKKLTERISSGELPLMEHVGEDLEFRLTCPRTLHLALTAIREGEPEVIFGLLTPNTASAILAFIDEDKDEESRIDETQRIARNVSKNKIKKIIRI